jgi:hypothetical protein
MDWGFTWYLIKDISKSMLYVLFFVACFGAAFFDAPWNHICLAYVIFGYIWFFVPLTCEVFKYKYKAYREQKEEAWNVLKEKK